MTRRKGRRSSPWYGNERQRLQFEWRVRASVREFRKRQSASGLAYDLVVDVPHYGPREVTIFLERGFVSPVVNADGPRSKHRFDDGSLCMWYPDDPDSRRWVFKDGLLALVGTIARHLFKEAWWDETGEWLGPEVVHEPKAPGSKMEDE